ncbi:hypothetical protein HanPSC8_Chr11g0453321 [Helianthus annuus]|nr:hypothetical protein HanPSC8_Chr11g0453321 [Helianthus annuus]
MGDGGGDGFSFCSASSGSCPAAATMVGYDWFQVSSPVLRQTSDKNPGKKPFRIKTAAAAAASSSDKHCVFHKMPKFEETAATAFAQVSHPTHATGEAARSFTVTTRRGKRTIHHYVEDDRDASRARARERARARASASAAGEDGDEYRYALNEDPYFKDHAARALANGCKVKLTASTMVIEQKPKSRDEYLRSLPPRFLQKLAEMEAQAKK